MKKPTLRGDCLKMALGQFTHLRGGFSKKKRGGGVFERGLISQCPQCCYICIYILETFNTGDSVFTLIYITCRKKVYW